MIVKYTPKDGDAKVWTFRPEDVKASQAEMIEKRAGMRYDEWAGEVLAGSVKARRVLLWHLEARVHPAHRIEDVPDFTMGEFVVERDLDELAVFRAQIERANIDETLRSAALSEIDAEIEVRKALGDDEGKANSK